MMRIFGLILFVAFFVSVFSHSINAGAKESKLLVLCYHSVMENVPEGNDYSISKKRFVEQLEYLKTHGYNPVSIEQVVQAKNGIKPLPSKPVLLTFDDGYQSYYDFIFPVLSKYNYPSTLAIVGSWIENGPPGDVPEPMMSWEQIRQLAQSDLVEIVSHSYNLHRARQYNWQGNVGAVVNVRGYSEEKGRYTTESEYRQELEQDFDRQAAMFRKRLNVQPRIMVWPYGKYNEVSISIAEENGMMFAFNLETGLADLNRPMRMNRLLIENRPMQDFIYQIKHPLPPQSAIRAVQLDLDLIYDSESYEQTDKNLGALIERLVDLRVDTVILQAFHDIEGSGNIRSVYFHNRILPVEADIFSHTVHQLIIRDFQVYAWLPTLSIVFPDSELNSKYRVRENDNGNIQISSSWYHRLTPFSDEVREKIKILYEDLAAGSQIHGILFQDDAYLAENEDYHPLALDRFSDVLGREIGPQDMESDPQLAERWAVFKTKALINFIECLKEGVRKYRPAAKFTRNLYAEVLLNPHSQAWFAQNYFDFLNSYDFVMVMAYPQMEMAKKPVLWLKQLVQKAGTYPSALEKTIFKIQTYEWKNEAWIDSQLLLQEMRSILSSGGRHIAYYPDNLWENGPDIDIVKLEMSSRVFPRVR